MSCWQSTILMLYYRERVTFALPCVLPVRPIYGPIMCNMLKCSVGGLRICTTIVLSHQTHRSLALDSAMAFKTQETCNDVCVAHAEALSVAGLRVCVHGSANFILALMALYVLSRTVVIQPHFPLPTLLIYCLFQPTYGC